MSLRTLPCSWYLTGPGGLPAVALLVIAVGCQGESPSGQQAVAEPPATDEAAQADSPAPRMEKGEFQAPPATDEAAQADSPAPGTEKGEFQAPPAEAAPEPVNDSLAATTEAAAPAGPPDSQVAQFGVAQDEGAFQEQPTADEAPESAGGLQAATQDSVAPADPPEDQLSESAPAHDEGAFQEQPAAEERGEEFSDEPAPADRGNPFGRRVPIRDFPKDMEWLNTSGPLRLSDLRGKFVLLDFWTYCCINCMHILPELKKLERAYPNELVVIGVHSAKFETERDAENISEAILRYEIEHPVINDNKLAVWNSFGVTTWPTILMIDPEGYGVWGRNGEFKSEDVSAVLKQAIPHYRKKGTLDETPIRFDLLADRQKETPLRFPGKVLADEPSNRLFIADSNHNRIVIADLAGRLLDVIGSGAVGATDGDYGQASFHHPQGMALRGEKLYVADTENHLLRKVDLRAKRVTTIAGVGKQAQSGWPGLENLRAYSRPPDRWVGRPRKTALSSPWALFIYGDNLFIAMAGPHQIWRMPLDELEIGPYAGNGREDIVDGPLLPRIPFETGYASFAQPSGLTSDGQWLYVADSEGSSIRAVPLLPAGEVKTVVGTAHLPSERLFEFGDVDGRGPQVRLQHVLGVTYYDGKLYLADTYNDKVKELNLQTLNVRTIAGGKSQDAFGETTFDEPAGVSYAAGKVYVADTNNHRIRTIDLAGGNQVETLEIQGLTAPPRVEQTTAPAFAGTPRSQVAPTAVAAQDGKITLRVTIELPQGWKINELAPTGYRVAANVATGPVDRAALGKTTRLQKPTSTFAIELPVRGEGVDSLDVGVTYYYCQEGGAGLCKMGNAAWTVPIQIKHAAAATVELTHAGR